MAQHPSAARSAVVIGVASWIAACSPAQVSEAAPAGEEIVTAAEAAHRVVAVAVSPKTASLASGTRLAFRCTVTGSRDTGCTWSLVEGPAGGAITSRGVYTAPATSGTYHVRATSHADRTKSDVATVTVSAPGTVSIAVAPATASVNSCRTAAFAATVTGTTNTAVLWSVLEGTSGGTVTASGVYTAPAVAGIYHVVGRSAADASKSQAATVTVTDAIVSVAVSPASVTVPGGGPAQFVATVTTSCGSQASGSSAGATGAVTEN